MNIQTVITNLKNTIADKESLLAEYQNASELSGPLTHSNAAKRMHTYAFVGFLKVNIDELKKILADVEQCIEKVEV